MTELYALKLAAAVMGGLAGLAWIFHYKPISRYRIFTEGLATVIFVWAILDSYFADFTIGQCAGLGFSVGFLNGYALDMLKAIAPKLVQFGFREWVAKILDLRLPESVFDENNHENQSVLDENRDREAVAWLDELPKKHYDRPTSSSYRKSGKQ